MVIALSGTSARSAITAGPLGMGFMSLTVRPAKWTGAFQRMGRDVRSVSITAGGFARWDSRRRGILGLLQSVKPGWWRALFV